MNTLCQLAFYFLLLISRCFSQELAAPFLLINNEPRSNGMGKMSVVSNSLNQPYHILQNPSLIVGKEPNAGLSFQHSAWHGLRLIDVNFFGAINNKNSLSASYRIITYPELTFTLVNSPQGQPDIIVSPKEFAHSLRYSRLLGRHFAIGIGFKYMHFDYRDGSEKSRSYGGDIGFDYRDEFKINDISGYKLNMGLAILNIGSKMKFTDAFFRSGNTSGYLYQSYFIPTIMNLGFMNSFKIAVAPRNMILFNIGYQIDKLLVPTPSETDADSNGIEDWNEKNLLQSMFGSFSDAPGGAREELREFKHHIGWGIEYVWNNKIFAAAHAGFYLEHEDKGGNKYYLWSLSFGAYWFHIDIAYNHALADHLSLLEKIWNVSVVFDLHFKSDRLAKFYN